MALLLNLYVHLEKMPSLTSECRFKALSLWALESQRDACEVFPLPPIPADRAGLCCHPAPRPRRSSLEGLGQSVPRQVAGCRIGAHRVPLGTSGQRQGCLGAVSLVSLYSALTSFVAEAPWEECLLWDALLLGHSCSR